MEAGSVSVVYWVPGPFPGPTPRPAGQSHQPAGQPRLVFERLGALAPALTRPQSHGPAGPASESVAGLWNELTADLYFVN